MWRTATCFFSTTRSSAAAIRYSAWPWWKSSLADTSQRDEVRNNTFLDNNGPARWRLESTWWN